MLGRSDGVFVDHWATINTFIIWFFFFQTYVVSVGVRAHQINLCIIHVYAQEVYDTFTKTGTYFFIWL